MPITITPIQGSMIQADEGKALSLGVKASGGVGPYKVIWVVKNGPIVQANADANDSSFFNYTFNDNGGSTIRAIVIDVNNLYATYIFTIAIRNLAPVAWLTLPAQASVGEAVRLSAVVLDADPVTYKWTVDGKTFTTPTVDYTFTKSGSYPVRLTVTDKEKAFVTAAGFIDIIAVDPLVVDAGPDVEVVANQTVAFSGVVDGGRAPYTYSWNFGDGSPIVMGLDQTHSFPAGTYNPVLTVTDSSGVVATDTVKVTVTPVIINTSRTLLGGWRLKQEFARGNIAIDFATNRCWMAGHAQRNEVLLFNLPPMGSGTDPNAWPIVNSSELIPGWWPSSEGYCKDLVFWKGKLWASPRVFYDTSPPSIMTWYAQDGEKITFDIGRQAFSGFMKSGPGQEPLIGGGGYESGQGWATGPTMAKFDSADPAAVKHATVLIHHPQTSSYVGRERREPNYYPIGHIDGWTAQEPRMLDGELVGFWASDRVYSGGLILPEGICYWVCMGLGEIDYALQNDTFSRTTMTYKYVYDPVTYKLLRWEATDLGAIVGAEVDSANRVYLSERNVWKSGLYKVDCAIKVLG